MPWVVEQGPVDRVEYYAELLGNEAEVASIVKGPNDVYDDEYDDSCWVCRSNGRA